MISPAIVEALSTPGAMFRTPPFQGVEKPTRIEIGALAEKIIAESAEMSRDPNYSFYFHYVNGSSHLVTGAMGRLGEIAQYVTNAQEVLRRHNVLLTANWMPDLSGYFTEAIDPLCSMVNCPTASALALLDLSVEGKMRKRVLFFRSDASESAPRCADDRNPRVDQYLRLYDRCPREIGTDRFLKMWIRDVNGDPEGTINCALREFSACVGDYESTAARKVRAHFRNFKPLTTSMPNIGDLT